MEQYTSEYEKGELKAERDVESGAVEDTFTASREADRFVREYKFERYHTADSPAEDFRQFKMGYAARLHDIAVEQAPGPRYPYGS